MIVTSKEGFIKSDKEHRRKFDVILNYTEGIFTIYHEDGDFLEFNKKETDQLYEFLQLARTTHIQDKGASNADERIQVR